MQTVLMNVVVAEEVAHAAAAFVAGSQPFVPFDLSSALESDEEDVNESWADDKPAPPKSMSLAAEV
jgi:hypothetical protein